MNTRKIFTSNHLFLGITILFVYILSACSNQNTTTEASGKNDVAITIGHAAGPYEDQFKEVIQPILSEQGITVNNKTFTNVIQLNDSVQSGEVHADIFQHTAYLNSYNQQTGADLAPLVKIASPPAGIYSNKQKLNAVPNNAKISIANDPSNTARSLVLLQEAGIIKLKDNLDPLKASPSDIIENPHNVKIVALEAAQLPRSLEDVDYAVIAGALALDSGLKLEQALLLEKVQPDLEIIVAVKKENLDKPWAKALAKAYQSKKYIDYIKTNNKTKDYHIPTNK